MNNQVRIINLHEYRVGDNVKILNAPDLGVGRVLRVESVEQWKRNITVVFDVDPTTHHYGSIDDVDLA